MEKEQCSGKCVYHDATANGLKELSESHYLCRDNQIKKHETIGCKIEQIEDDMAKNRLVCHVCKTKTLPNIRSSIGTNNDTLCRILNNFKTETRKSVTDTREDFILRLGVIMNRISYAYGFIALTGLILGWMFISVGNLHADSEKVKDRQTHIEVVNTKIQSDVEYLKKGMKSLNDKLDRVLDALQNKGMHSK